MEVVVEQLRHVGEYRQGRIGAHSAHCLGALFGHGHDYLAYLLVGIAKRLQPRYQRQRLGRGRGCRRGQLVHAQRILPYPVRIGVALGHGLLQLVVLYHAALLGIYQQHAAGPQALLVEYVIRLHGQRSRFGGQYQPAVARFQIARRAQAVAVQHRRHLNAVCKHHGGRAVPRVHQMAVELVERAQVVVHLRVLLPGLGYHHHRGVGERAPGHGEELQGVVEHGRIRAVGAHYREQLLQLVAKQVGLYVALARQHARAVAAYGVYLAVVHHHAVGVRALPGGEGVGGIARMQYGYRAGKVQIGQVHKQRAQLPRLQHALVNYGAAGEAARVEVGFQAALAVAQAVFGAAAYQVQLALKGHAGVVLLGQTAGALYEHLTDVGHGLKRGAAQRADVDRHLAPAQQGLAVLGHYAAKLLHHMRAALLVPAQEQHAHAVSALLGQTYAQRRADLLEELVRQLCEHARAVAGKLVRARRAAVAQRAQHVYRVGHELVAGAALYVAYHAYAAGVVFKFGIIESPARRQAGLALLRAQGGFEPLKAVTHHRSPTLLI